MFFKVSAAGEFYSPESCEIFILTFCVKINKNL